MVIITAHGVKLLLFGGIYAKLKLTFGEIHKHQENSVNYYVNIYSICWADLMSNTSNMHQ